VENFERNRGEPVTTKKIKDIDFEILGNTEECNIADKFNLYYIQSINNIVKYIIGYYMRETSGTGKVARA